MIIQSIPLLLVIILLARIFTNLVTKPINQLAQFSKEATLTKKITSIHNLKIKSHCYEVRKLWNAFNNIFIY